MIKADVRGLIKMENIRLIKKPLKHLPSLIYFIVTLFGHCLKVTAPHISFLIEETLFKMHTLALWPFHLKIISHCHYLIYNSLRPASNFY